MKITLLTIVVIFLIILKKLLPTKQDLNKSLVSLDQDQQIIDGLIKYGSNPEKEHGIEFAFFGNLEDTNNLKNALLPQGYTWDTAQSTKDMLIMIKFLKLYLPEIKSEISKMETLAREYNVEFDGWSAVIVK
jgi:hypothetical protein